MVDRVFSFSIRKFVLNKTNQLLDYVEVQLIDESKDTGTNVAPVPTCERTDIEGAGDRTDAESIQTSCHYTFESRATSPQPKDPSTTESDSDTYLTERKFTKSGKKHSKSLIRKYNGRRPSSIVGICEEPTTSSSDGAVSDSESVHSNYSTISCPHKTLPRRRKNVSFNLEPQVVLFKLDSNTEIHDVRTVSLPSLFGSPKVKLMIQTRRPSRTKSVSHTEGVYCSGHKKRSELSRIIRYD